MVFSKSVSTPAGTLASLPLSSIIKIDRGIIHKWVVSIPAGSQGALSFRIRKGSVSLFPVNTDGWISGDNYVINGEDFIYIKQPPFELEVQSFNTDVHDHIIHIHVFIKPLWTYLPYSRELLELMLGEEQLRVV